MCLYFSEGHFESLLIWMKRIKKKMTEDSSASSELSVDMTTTGIALITGENTTLSSSSRNAEFYFQCSVLIIGVVGTANNALILYALVASKQHKKHVLIFNQNALDLFSSFFMVLTYSLKLCNIRLTGSVGYWLCMLLVSDSLIWCGTVGSAINLASISVERYLKVVHPELRSWMIYLVMAFSWVGSFVYNAALVFPTSAVVDGACYAYVFWKSETARIFHDIWTFVSFYVIILLIFIFCYWRILVVIRRQSHVMAGVVTAGPNTAEIISSQIQSSVIKTMILVCALYAISWLPVNVYILNMDLNPNSSFTDGSNYYASISIAFLYTCTNPFIYAISFTPVREILLRLVVCKKTSE